MAEESKTPMLDQLESGSWPSFALEIKKRQPRTQRPRIWPVS